MDKITELVDSFLLDDMLYFSIFVATTEWEFKWDRRAGLSPNEWQIKRRIDPNWTHYSLENIKAKLTFIGVAEADVIKQVEDRFLEQSAFSIRAVAAMFEHFGQEKMLNSYKEHSQFLQSLMEAIQGMMSEKRTEEKSVNTSPLSLVKK